MEHPNWRTLLSLDVPILEILVRGSLMYLALFSLLRFVLKRQSGTIGVTDLLVVVLVADAAQNGMAGEYQSITSGVLLVAVIMFWSYALDWLGHNFEWAERLVHPPPLLLIENGTMLYRNMKKELLTKEELMSQLREQGIEDVSEVKRAYMEGDGKVSIISKEDDHHPKNDQTVS